MLWKSEWMASEEGNYLDKLQALRIYGVKNTHACGTLCTYV
jgi:hypothetical protein